MQPHRHVATRNRRCTVEILVGHDEPDPAVAERHAALREQIKDRDRRLERYRTAIDHADGEIDSITNGLPKSSASAKGSKRNSAEWSRAGNSPAPK